jgi:hypothetical protein
MARNPRRTVLGVYAPPPRPTVAGALWLACVVSLPAGLLLGMIDIMWRLVR